MFCQVILPLHLPSSFTYRIPEDLLGKVQVGCRVAVQFGKKRIYSGIVCELHNRVPTLRVVKFVLELIDPVPIISEENLSLWQWTADYYACYVGDVMNAALPAAFRLRSETKLLVEETFTGEVGSLSDTEMEVLDFVSKKKTTDIAALSEQMGEKNILPAVNRLIKAKVLATDEQLYDRYTPKTEDYLTLSETCKEEENLKNAVKELEKTKKTALQLETLMRFLSEAKIEGSVRKSDFQKNNSQSAIAGLIAKGILTVERLAFSRLAERQSSARVEDIVLSEEQTECFNHITESLKEKPVCLLHGVTGSGKTEVYIKLIERTLASGGQVLYLLPEIALSVQLISRLEKYFGRDIGVYHSRFSKDERVEIWNKVRSKQEEGGYRLVVGSRSAIFLPFTDLRLIIVDEEHDSGFKQSEPAPRCNARDMAVYLAWTKGLKVVLGSATPSVESYFLSQTEKFGYAALTKRYAGYRLPEIQLADLKQEMRSHSMYSIFSELLYTNIERALKERRQVILFRNLRGFASTLRCEVCGWEARCKNCDVSLTVHRGEGLLKCHYCSHSEPIPTECPECHSHSLRMVGTGSEKLEEEAAKYFPGARVARLDWDTGSKKNAYQRIVDEFASGKIDILCGTQLVSKGFDFSNVGLVGVIDADAMLAYPDFRSYERTFDMLTQLAGRAGRSPLGGKVIIQTFNPYHQVFKDVYSYDYSSMYNSQIVERKLFRYPPFYHLVRISLQCALKETLDEFAENYSQRLRAIFGGRILGPEYPPIAKVRNLYRKELMLKLEREVSYAKAKQEILRLNEEITASYPKKQVRIIVDIDPQ